MKSLISQFLSGAAMMGCLIIGFFFFRFWRKTRDGLFAAFAACFWVLAIERVLLLITADAFAREPGIHEYRPFVYWIRLLAFVLLIAGFVLKNRRSD
jgi:hypothetical protein